MPGTAEGAKKAAETNRKRYGTDYYQNIGAKGKEAWMAKPKEERKPQGFAANKELARKAGAKGGSVSRRGKAQT